MPLTSVPAGVLPPLGTHPGGRHAGQGYWVAPFPPSVEFEIMLILIDAESVPPGFVTVTLIVWVAPGLPPANEKLIETVRPRFTADGLAEMVPVTAHAEGMKVGIRT